MEPTIYAAAGQQQVKRDEVEIEQSQPAANQQQTRNNRRTQTRQTNKAVRVSVKRGDTLSAIARRNHTTVAKIKQLNGLRGNNIRVGQSLRVK